MAPDVRTCSRNEAAMFVGEPGAMSQIPDGGRRIALIAHDNKKIDMREWAGYNRHRLVEHELFATATTGHILREDLGLDIVCFRSGPYGGDQQIGARIAEGEIDLLVFFWDPLQPHPHDPDVKALLRVAVVCNIPVACNRATADFMISSPLMARPHAHPAEVADPVAVVSVVDPASMVA